MAIKRPDYSQSTAAMFLTLSEKQRDEIENGIDPQNCITDVSIARISEFPNHPFQVRQDDAMMNMVESIRQSGVRQPVIIHPLPEGGYEGT